MRGLFIPEITAEMFRNGCLESIEALIAEGEIYDIEYPLKQEPCEDAISRQTVINNIERWLSCGDYNEAERNIMRAMQSVLYDLPLVTPKPKMGHWIDVDATHGKCDRCGAIFEIVSSNGEVDYCPNCGCCMVDPQERSGEE